MQLLRLEFQQNVFYTAKVYNGRAASVCVCAYIDACAPVNACEKTLHSVVIGIKILH
jgi:hypothetical protein